MPASHETLRIPAHLYQLFDADHARDVPAEATGGWRSAPVELPLASTALVSMHAWDVGSHDEVPARYRTCEYHSRANRILRDVFPPLLAAARGAGMTVLHVADGGDYYKRLPGYKKALALAPEEVIFTGEAPHSDANVELRKLKQRLGYTGEANQRELATYNRPLDFAPQARPLDHEGIAQNANQLSALCREAGVSHLIYIGFAINWCLLTSPAGMNEMHRKWYLCSTVRDATTALESKESARAEGNKEYGLWRVAAGFGFVFDAPPLIAELNRCAAAKKHARAGA